MPRTTITNTDDVIDSRDIIARIEELQAERDGWVESPDHAGDDPSADVRANYNLAWASEFEDDAAELAALESLAEEAEGYAPDWHHGETLIRDSYFTEYAMDLLADIGDLPRNIPHYIVIDREATARNIQYDYISVEFDGVTYWFR